MLLTLQTNNKTSHPANWRVCLTSLVSSSLAQLKVLSIFSSASRCLMLFGAEKKLASYNEAYVVK